MVTPKMRFKTDSCMNFSEWETKRADELFESITDKNHPEEEVLTIIQGHGTVPRNKSGRNIQYDDKGLIGYKRVQKNDFIIHLRSFEGGLEIANENGIVSPAYIILRGKYDIAPGFYNEYFHTNRFINQNLAKAVEGIRDGRQISFNTFCQLNIPYPCIEEQNKIATLFSTLDTVIANCQSEVDAWVKYKRGMMQQLFSQKVRFKADDGSEYMEWKEYKLDDICNINPQTENLEDEFYYIDLGSVVSGQLISLETIQKYNAPSRAQRVLSDGDVLFQSVRPYQKNHFLYRNEYDKQVVASTGYCQMQMKNGNSSFLFQLLFSDAFNSEVNKKCAGSNYPAINSKVLSEIKVYIPQATEEQQKIADCLSAFDEVIEKAKQKLEAYKRLKHGLLQQMFV